MKIEFDDKSYVEIQKTTEGKIIIMIQAKDHDNHLKKITNAVELTAEQFKELTSEL